MGRERVYTDEERKERQKAAMKKWKENDLDGFLDARHRAQKNYKKRVEEKNPGTMAAYGRKSYAKNREKCIERSKQYFIKNKEIVDDELDGIIKALKKEKELAAAKYTSPITVKTSYQQGYEGDGKLDLFNYGAVEYNPFTDDYTPSSHRPNCYI